MQNSGFWCVVETTKHQVLINRFWGVSQKHQAWSSGFFTFLKNSPEWYLAWLFNVHISTDMWTSSYIALFYGTGTLKALYTTCFTHPFIPIYMLFLWKCFLSNIQQYFARGYSASRDHITNLPIFWATTIICYKGSKGTKKNQNPRWRKQIDPGYKPCNMFIRTTCWHQCLHKNIIFLQQHTVIV